MQSASPRWRVLTLRKAEYEKAEREKADSFPSVVWSRTVDRVDKAPSLQKESAMIFADSLPGFKGLLRPLALPIHALCHVTWSGTGPSSYCATT